MSLPDVSTNGFSVLTATPDLLAQGLVPALLNKLAARGVRVVGAMPYAFSPPAATELYAGRITHQRHESRKHSGWLNPRMFAAGPSLILFLRSDGPGTLLVNRIREMKGSSRLGEHTPDQLRSLSPLTDRGFSLVHSPDDIEGVMHELGIVLGARAMAEVLVPERPSVRSEEIVSILPFVPLSAERHPFDILPRVIAQVASLCACAPFNAAIAGPASRLFDGAQRCRHQLARHPVDQTLEHKLWTELSSLQDGVDQLIVAQRTQLDWTLPALVLRVVLEIALLLTTVTSACVEEMFTAMECEALIKALHACHVSLSDWDEHRLRLIAAYHCSAASEHA